MPFETAVLDNFNRANNADLGANWTPVFQTCQIVDNTATGGTAGTCVEYWNASTPAADCEVFFTVTTLPAVNEFCRAGVRLAGVGNIATLDGYVGGFQRLSGTDLVVIQRIDNGPATTIASGSLEISAGDSVGLRVIGSALSLWHRPSGGSWAQVLSVADGTYSAAGRLGIAPDGTTVRVNDFGGGAIAAVELAGSARLDGDTDAALQVTRPLSGAVGLTLAQTAQLAVQKVLTGSAATDFTVSGALVRTVALEGQTALALDADGALVVTKALSGAAVLFVSVSAALASGEAVGVIVVVVSALERRVQVAFRDARVAVPARASYVDIPPRGGVVDVPYRSRDVN